MTIYILVYLYYNMGYDILDTIFEFDLYSSLFILQQVKLYLYGAPMRFIF